MWRKIYDSQNILKGCALFCSTCGKCPFALSRYNLAQEVSTNQASLQHYQVYVNIETTLILISWLDLGYLAVKYCISSMKFLEQLNQHIIYWYSTILKVNVAIIHHYPNCTCPTLYHMLYNVCKNIQHDFLWIYSFPLLPYTVSNPALLQLVVAPDKDVKWFCCAFVSLCTQQGLGNTRNKLV